MRCPPAKRLLPPPHGPAAGGGKDGGDGALPLLVFRPLDAALLAAAERGWDGAVVALICTVVAIATAIGVRRVLLVAPPPLGVCYSLTDERRRRCARVRRRGTARSSARFASPPRGALSDEEGVAAEGARGVALTPATTLRGDRASMLALAHVILALLALTVVFPLLAPQWSFFGTQRTTLASTLARGASGSATSARCAVLLMAQGADAEAQRCRVARPTLFLARTLSAFPLAALAASFGLAAFASIVTLRVAAAAVRGLGLSAARADADAEQRRRAREDALVHIDRNEYFVGNGEL